MAHRHKKAEVMEKETPKRRSPIRVLHVYRTYFPDPPGGLQEAIRQIRQSTRPYGISSTVFCLSPDPSPSRIDAPDGRIVRARSWAAPASCDLGGAEAFRIFREQAADHDLIHYHFPWPFADLLHMAIKPRIPAVMTYHADIVRQMYLARLYSPLMWRTLRSMSAIIATSPDYIATSPILQDPRISARVHMIPLGMADLRAMQPPPAPLPVPEGVPFFLFIGALRYYKGLQNLVAAARHVNAPVLIAGEGAQGEKLKQMAQAAGAKNIMFLGPISDACKRNLLARCLAFVMPSNQRSEAFGLAMVEAAMFGKPLISCEIGTGTSYVNLKDKTGLVVPPDDPEALANVMNRLLHEPELVARLGSGARSHYETNLVDVAMGKAYAQLYQEILKHQRQHDG